MKNDMDNFEYLIRLLKKRNFDKMFIGAVVFSTDSEELLGKLAKYIEDNDIYDEESVDKWVEKNIGWDHFTDDDENEEDDE